VDCGAGEANRREHLVSPAGMLLLHSGCFFRPRLNKVCWQDCECKLFDVKLGQPGPEAQISTGPGNGPGQVEL
jgi:hypothetical protein